MRCCTVASHTQSCCMQIVALRHGVSALHVRSVRNAVCCMHVARCTVQPAGRTQARALLAVLVVLSSLLYFVDYAMRRCLCARACFVYALLCALCACAFVRACAGSCECACVRLCGCLRVCVCVVCVGVCCVCVCVLCVCVCERARFVPARMHAAAALRCVALRLCAPHVPLRLWVL